MPCRTKPRIRQSPKLPASQRRAELLAAAAELFFQQGYRNTTTEQIARRAGVTKGALYFHFRTKETLLVELVREMTRSWLEPLEVELPMGCTPGEFIRRVEGCNRRWARPDWHFLDFWTQALAIPRIKAHLNRSFRKALAIFVERVSPQFGRTAAERRRLGIHCLCLLHGLMIRKVLDSSLVNVNAQLALLDELVDGLARRNRQPRVRPARSLVR